jgi:hypothetical protein
VAGRFRQSKNRASCNVWPRFYHEHLKPLVIALASVAGVWISGCASDTPPAEAVQEHLQRGATGHGELGPINRGPDDPYLNPGTGDATPVQP